MLYKQNHNILSDTSNTLPDSFHVVQIIALGADARLDLEGHDD